MSPKCYLMRKKYIKIERKYIKIEREYTKKYILFIINKHPYKYKK